MRVKNRSLFPFLLAFVFVVVGIIFLRPCTVQQISTLTVSLVLLAYIPWVIEPGFRRSVAGIFLGALLGWPVAASFNFWPIEIVFVALGWTVGIAAGQSKASSTVRKPIFNFSLAFTFSVTFLFAAIFFVVQFQSNALAKLESSLVLIDRSFAVRPNARILIKFNSAGDYVLGEEITDDYSVAASILKQNIETLLDSGISPDEIFITCIASNKMHSNKVWLLREAFDNVRGRELSVAFLNPSVEISIKDNGDFVVANQLSSDRSAAASILRQKIDILFSAGVTADEIRITSGAVDQADRDSVLLLRNEAGGKNLAVEFRPQ